MLQQIDISQDLTICIRIPYVEKPLSVQSEIYTQGYAYRMNLNIADSEVKTIGQNKWYVWENVLVSSEELSKMREGQLKVKSHYYYADPTLEDKQYDEYFNQNLDLWIVKHTDDSDVDFTKEDILDILNQFKSDFNQILNQVNSSLSDKVSLSTFAAYQTHIAQEIQSALADIASAEQAINGIQGDISNHALLIRDVSNTLDAVNETIDEIEKTIEQLKSKEVDLSGYVQLDALSAYVRQEELSGFLTRDALSGLVGQDKVDNLSGEINRVESKIDRAFVNIRLDLFETMDERLEEDYYTADEVNNIFAYKRDLSGFLKQDALSGFAKLSDIPQPIDTSNFATKDMIPSVSGFLTASDLPTDHITQAQFNTHLSEFALLNEKISRLESQQGSEVSPSIDFVLGSPQDNIVQCYGNVIVQIKPIGDTIYDAEGYVKFRVNSFNSTNALVFQPTMTDQPQYLITRQDGSIVLNTRKMSNVKVNGNAVEGNSVFLYQGDIVEGKVIAPIEEVGYIHSGIGEFEYTTDDYNKNNVTFFKPLR